MSYNCSHPECEPYDRCQAATEKERRRDFWCRYRGGASIAELGTDPLAWLNGDVPDQ